MALEVVGSRDTKGWRPLWVLAVPRQGERKERFPGDRATAAGQFVVGCDV